MNHRGVEIAGFLTQHGWDTAAHTAFDADFSSRRYARLTKENGEHVILMDADPDQKTPNFIAIARLLRQLDISAPTILAANPRLGLVLLEDFGDQNFGAMIDGGQDPRPLLMRAVEVLVQLHRHFMRDMARDIDLPVFNAQLFADQAALLLDTYIAFVLDRDVGEEEREGFRVAWLQSLAHLDDVPTSLLLRDYMPDNLMDLAGREAWRSVGVLDFQDAGIGPVAYDLASLAEVVRRDGMETHLESIVTAYHNLMKPAYTVQDLRTACIILSAQRHTRIMGLVVRLAQKGRTEKLAYLPRIRQHLATLVRHEALQPVASWFNEYCPL